MIKFFKKFRRDQLSRGKTGKYLSYALGEIALLVVGILIALQINNWNEELKKEELKQVYIENLVKDLTNDRIQLCARIDFNENVVLRHLDSVLNIIMSPQTTIQDIKDLGKNFGIAGLRVINNYNTKTFNTLTSSGNIDLFDDAIVQKIMELNVLQNFELKISIGNRNTFFDMYGKYREKYLQRPGITNEQIAITLWDNVNAEEHAAIYINVTNVRFHTTSRYVELSKEVLEKSEDLLEDLENY